MKEVDLRHHKDAVLAAVPSDGTTVGNAALRERCNLSVEDYQQVVQALVEDGAVERWRGRGGTVRRTAVSVSVEAKPKPKGLAEEERAEREAGARAKVLEAKLYPPFLASLKLWANDQGWTQHVVLQTASQGRRNTGGTWTRPDFVVIGYRKFEYTPGIVRDVETFELKTSTCGIEAVFETAAHSRVATKSFLAIQTSEEAPTQDELDRIESECVRFGLGLIVFRDPSEYGDWSFRVEPSRAEPDPFNLEEFVQTQVPELDREKIRKWLR